MTEDSKAQLEEAGDLLDAKGGCADVWEKASESSPPTQNASSRIFEIESVRVDGDTASVTTADAKGGGSTRLVKEDGEWRVDFEQQ